MIAYVLNNKDLSIRDILFFENYTFSEDIEFNEKSSITTIAKPNVENDDFVLCKDGNEIIFLGICEDYSTSSDSDSVYTINLKQKECMFDRQIFVGDESIINTTGMEDFIVSEITNNWIDSGDSFLDKDYISISATSHTPLDKTVESDNGVYNLKTFLGNVKELYSITIGFELSNTQLVLTVYKDVSTELPIDVTITDVSNYDETYNVDVLSKLTVKTQYGYDRLEYLESTGTQWIMTNFALDTAEKLDSVKIHIRASHSGTGNFLGRYASSGFYAMEVPSSYPDKLRCFTGNASQYTDRTGLHSDNVTIDDITFYNTDTTAYQIINDIEYSQTRSGTATLSDVPLAIFARSNSASAVEQILKMKLYELEFYLGDTLISNFIPAKRLDDEVVGLLDKVNNVFYENKGTGEFVAGSDLGELIDINSYYLRKDKTITTDISDPNRVEGTVKSITNSPSTEPETDLIPQHVQDEFKSNSYEHKISFDLSKFSNAYRAQDYYVGRNAKIKTKTGIQTSLITGMSRSSDSAFISFIFGKLKITLIEKLRRFQS